MARQNSSGLRTEIAGEFFHHWQWQLSADFGPTSTDNPAARLASRDCTVDPVTGVRTCDDRTNPVEAPLQKPAATDAFINYGPCSWFNFQVGQYLLPFTMENRVSDNTTKPTSKPTVKPTSKPTTNRNVMG